MSVDAPSTNTDLTLSEMVQRVMQRNENLQARLLSFEAQRRRAKGEYGIFEPEFFGSAGREVNNRRNTAEQQVSLLTPTFFETNNIYQGGIEGLVPTGTRVRLGYTLRDLQNNLQPLKGATNGEYQTFFGISATQPLLKNFGTAATMAGIRLAAISNKMAFQDYRRTLMTAVSSAEATYWNLYLAQEQVRFFQDSIKTAETILKDNRTRLEAGKGSELEVLEAEAGLALRRTKLSEAQQKVIEAANRVISLYAEDATETNLPVRAVDVPQLRSGIPDYVSLRQAAFDLNPDFLIARERVQQDMVRLGFARNQRLPELDLKGNYGLNGLGRTPYDSWRDVEQQNFPSWFVGAEFRVPIAGGIKGRNDLAAARLELESSQMTLRALQTEIVNGMNTAWHKLQSTRDNVGSYETTVKYNRSLLDSALTRLEAGKIESRKVLEIEADLFEAKLSVVESLVRHQLALLELELIQGALLQRRHLEITQGELRSATQQFAKSRRLGDEPYERGMREVHRLHQAAAIPDNSSESPADRRVRQELLDRTKQMEIRREVDGGLEAVPPPAVPSAPAVQPPKAQFSEIPSAAVQTNAPDLGPLLQKLRQRERELDREEKGAGRQK